MNIYGAPCKALSPSGLRSPPGNCRSSRKQSERMMEVTTSFEALRRNGLPWAA